MVACCVGCGRDVRGENARTALCPACVPSYESPYVDEADDEEPDSDDSDYAEWVHDNLSPEMAEVVLREDDDCEDDDCEDDDCEDDDCEDDEEGYY